MTFTRQNGGAAIVKFALTQVGKGYSEQSPSGSEGDGHLWYPGEPLPTVYDCSGFVCTCLRSVGIHAISNGNAQDQWKQHLGGIIPAQNPLMPGDVGAFLGSENVPGYAGHTAIVVTYDHVSRVGTLVNAYDTEKGVCEIAFDRPQVHNGNNGLGVLGFYRPANRFPSDPPRP